VIAEQSSNQRLALAQHRARVRLDVGRSAELVQHTGAIVLPDRIEDALRAALVGRGMRQTREERGGRAGGRLEEARGRFARDAGGARELGDDVRLQETHYGVQQIHDVFLPDERTNIASSSSSWRRNGCAPIATRDQRSNVTPRAAFLAARARSSNASMRVAT